MVKELCFRCTRPVYPTDKVGPLKDGAFFHQGCFKCYICGTRLALRSYCHSRQRQDDREVYCTNHAPQANAHDPVPHRSTLLGTGSPAGAAPVVDNADGAEPAVLIGDMRIQHALKATEIQKPYPKIVHSGAKYIVDYDQQTRLELIHRKEEDELYNAFTKQREEEERRLSNETKEEWEIALNEFAAKYERDMRQNRNLSPSKDQAKDDMIRQLTIKRDRRKETMRMTLKEKERTLTSNLLEKQSVEMMDLFRKARQQVKEDFREMDNKKVGNGHYKTTNGSNGDQNTSSNGYHHHSHQEHHHNSSVSTTYHQYQGSAETNGETSPSSYPSTPPPPFPPTTSKTEICSETILSETIDKIAVSVAQSEINSFTDLIRALTCNCRNDIEKARAIYRWITIKNLNLMEFDNRIGQDTPMGLLRGIKYGTESYHVLFKRLCSYAGLHCVVIKGFSKSAGYQPGMSFDDGRFRNTWNAVFLDGAWRFVQCNWGARHLVNANKAGTGSALETAPPAENLRYEYDDHYFMTDPQHFIYEFWPRQPEWQLLHTPVTLHHFERLPFVRSLFFRYGLGFADGRMTSAVVFADKTGAAAVALNVQSTSLTSKLIFHYNLKFYDSEKQEFDRVSLKRFVMQSSVGNTVLFRVHAPCKGDYLLDIFANCLNPGEYLSGQPMKFKSVCKFKVICDKLTVVMVPLPECASGEWGPAKAKRLFGMIPVSHEDAIINSGADLDITFKLSKPLAEFVASLRKNGSDERKLSKMVQQSGDRNSVTFRIRFQEEGQYGLDLYTREASSNGGGFKHQELNAKGDPNLLTHCCKYLINARV